MTGNGGGHENLLTAPEKLLCDWENLLLSWV
jgi:hypothetical protein